MIEFLEIHSNFILHIAFPVKNNFSQHFEFKTLFVNLRTINLQIKMKNKRFTPEQENIARIAKAIAHPVRITILQMLASRECCYHGDISDVIPLAKSTLSQHLKELKDAGLIQGTVTAPNIKYCINQTNWNVAKIFFDNFFHDIKTQTECQQ